jgi:hypothetical protein
VSRRASTVPNFCNHPARRKARRAKSERTKTLGSPIQLPGKSLAILIRGGHAWIGENTTVARKIELEVWSLLGTLIRCSHKNQTGKTLQIYWGHTGPVTSIAFCDQVRGSGDEKILITGSWDKVSYPFALRRPGPPTRKMSDDQAVELAGL